MMLATIKNFFDITLFVSVIMVLFILLPLSVFSQKSKKGGDGNVKTMIKEADDLYADGNKKEAIALYDKIEGVIDSEDVDFLWKIGNAYLGSVDKFKSVTYFLEIDRLQPSYNPDLKLKIGEAYEYMYDYDNALKYYNEYKNEAKKGLKETYVNKKIQQANWGKQMSAIDDGTIVVNVINEPVNSKFHDYAPKITPDGVQMIYTSRRYGSTGQQVSEDGNFFEDIFITRKLSTGGWEFPTSISSNINTEYHDAAVSISADGNSILLYKGEENGNIYISNKNGGQWSVPEPLGPAINTKSRESTATFGIDKNTVIFSSDRSGTNGKLDLWMSVKGSNGKWGKAVNLGNKINTNGDEESPYMIDNTIYFSSNGHLGLGGYDIFKATKNGDNWNSPVNMATPINSPYNDLYFVITADHSRAYFSSARPEGVGGYDIFEIRFDGVKKLSETVVYEEPEEEVIDEEEVLSSLTLTPLNSLSSILNVINDDSTSDAVRNELLNIKEITNENINEDIPDTLEQINPPEEIIISNPINE